MKGDKKARDNSRWTFLLGVYQFFVVPNIGSDYRCTLGLDRIYLNQNDPPFGDEIRDAFKRAQSEPTLGRASATLHSELEGIANHWQLPAVAF